MATQLGVSVANSTEGGNRYRLFDRGGDSQVKASRKSLREVGLERETKFGCVGRG